MLRREFLQLFGMRSVLAAPNPAAQRDDAEINVLSFGAAGDGVHDDTEALQNAINYALSNEKSCFVPPGRYRTSAPLLIGRPEGESLRQGFTLHGVGRAIDRAGGTGGTLILLVGNGHKAIISIEKSVWRSATISDLGLECTEESGARFGLLFNSTEFSGHLVRSISVHGTEVAFGILQGSGANGENILFENCYAANVGKFFYSNAGQAYVQNFIHCGCILRSEGTYFHFDLAAGGGGLEVIDFNGTGTRPANGGPSNTTLIDNGNSNSCLNFFGGRIEHLTRLYATKGGSTNLHVTADFRGLQLTIDRRSDRAGRRFIELRACPDILNISSCSVEGISGNEVVEILTKESWGYILFSKCFFDSLARPPSIISDFSDVSNQVRFEDCKTVSKIDEAGGRRPVPFERVYHHDVGAIGRRKAFSENGWIHSGRPINLLALPHFTGKNGRGVRADPPWYHSGISHVMNAFDWNQSSARPDSSSPWAKLIELPPKSGLFQDVSYLDLSSPATSYELRGASFHVVTYQAMIGRLAGRTNIRFSLCDSVDGQIYDQLEFAESAGSSVFTRLITLAAYVARKAERSYVRLAIENVSSDWAIIEFRWQLAANGSNAAFVGTGESPTMLTGEWGLSTESGRFWHRLALPYKADGFGSESERPLDDLQSDIYLSRSTERIHAFANSRWWLLPRLSSSSAVPINGYWAQGDIAFNCTPNPGAPVGWIQILPGDIVAQKSWTPATPYVAGFRVYNGTSVYDCVRTGVSALSSGPINVNGLAEDGTCIWKFIGTLAPVACGQSWSPRQFEAQDRVQHLGNVYECTAGGYSTVGPVGMSVTEGTLNWRFLGRQAIFKTIGKVGQ